MPGGHFPEHGTDVVEDALATKVAILLVTGKNISQISKELGISRDRIRTLMDSDECIRGVRKLEEEGLRAAKVMIRLGVSKIAKKVLDVIEHHLDNNNLQAVAPALKILGFTENDAPQADQSITVILPKLDSNGSINITPNKAAEETK